MKWIDSLFKGRIGRAKFWLFVLVGVIAILVGIAIIIIGTKAGGPRGGGVVSGFLLIFAMIAFVPVGIKRLHDRGKSGWRLLAYYFAPLILSFPPFDFQIRSLGVVIWPGQALFGSPELSVQFPFLGFVVFILVIVELGCLRGTIGPNRYGPDPLEGRV